MSMRPYQKYETPKEREAAQIRADRLRKEGWKMQDIADEIGVSTPTISKWLRRHETWRTMDGQLKRGRGRPREYPGATPGERREFKCRLRRDQVAEYKAELSCKVCGESDPVVLDLHHRNPKSKKAAVSNLFQRSAKTIAEEIFKCDVICSNCHRRETAKMQAKQ